METKRRVAGFERLGAGGAATLGLGARRAHALALEAAWRRAAGASIARRAAIVGRRRGVLAIAVTEDAWRRVIGPLLPEIASRLREAAPELGITSVRIVDASPH